MLNYQVDPDLLRQLVPWGTSIDLFREKAYISIVAFLFLHTRVLGLSIPFHRNFEEVNLRFYVQREHNDGKRRGTVFVKELVPKFAVAAIARAFYNEQYFAAKMQHKLLHQGPRLQLGFDWRFAGFHHSLSAEAQGEPQPLIPASETEFIADHYWGYTRQRNGGTVEYRVRHVPWRIWNATEWSADVNWKAMYGPCFAAALAQQPSSVFIAEGSPVTISRGRKLK